MHLYRWNCIWASLFAGNFYVELVGLWFKNNVCGSIDVISSMHKCLPGWVPIKAHWHQGSNGVLWRLYGWRCNSRWIGSLKPKELMSCYLEETEIAAKNWCNAHHTYQFQENTFFISVINLANFFTRNVNLKIFSVKYRKRPIRTMTLTLQVWWQYLFN